jgi:adenine-specific DNA-methyltransferase
LNKSEPTESLAEDIEMDYEALKDTAEEWGETGGDEPISESERLAIQAEIADLDDFARLATSIDDNAKGKALLKALHIAMSVQAIN